MGGYADYKVVQFILDVFVRGMMKEGQDFIFRRYSDFSEVWSYTDDVKKCGGVSVPCYLWCFQKSDPLSS